MSSTGTVLVTGASGFIGRATCQWLVDAGLAIRAQHCRRPPPPGTRAVTFDLAAGGDWASLLGDARAVVHLAGLAHVPHTASHRGQAHETIMRINVEASQQLARVAARAGAKMIFVSTAKVLGETGRFTDEALPAPPDPYAESKWRAEQALLAETRLNFITLRPPLVYGPGVGANFLRLLEWVARGWPLPLAGASNCRSLIGVENLVSAIQACLADRQPHRRAYLVGDDEAPTMRELIMELSRLLGSRTRLMPLPIPWLRAAAALVGRRTDADRVLGEFVVDDSQFRRSLHWRPVIGRADELGHTVAWFRALRAARPS